MAKKKKDKTIYYDDDSTIVDMSEVSGLGRKKPPSEPKKRSTFQEKWRTYWGAVKAMLLPMCVVLLVLALLYVFFMFLAGRAG